MAAAVDGAAGGWDSGANGSWNAGSAGGGNWDGGVPTGDAWNGGGDSTAVNDDAFASNAGMVESNADAADGNFICRHCSKPGHKARECPDKPEDFGKCFNCGQEGHNKADCTEPRVFTGTCNTCGKEGHRKSECPDKVPSKCRNCGEEGHEVKDCTANRKLDRSTVEDLDAEEAWNRLVKVDSEMDMEGVRESFAIYTKACPEADYVSLETAFRGNAFNLHLIAIEKELPKTHTFINLQGERDKTYQVGLYWADQPKRQKISGGWPKSADENLVRLSDAGMPMERLIPKCGRCDELGHIAKNCSQEQDEAPVERMTMVCPNCSETGHRARDCTAPRKAARGPMTCRNCGQEGHKKDDCDQPPDLSGVECRNCGGMGHFSKDCEIRKCRNCNEEGHVSKECDKPKNPENVTCRNCDTKGHFSRDCPLPRDYSKVECSNCHQMGHTKVRCKEPAAEEATGNGYADANGGDYGNTGAQASGGADGWANAGPTEAVGGW